MARADGVPNERKIVRVAVIDSGVHAGHPHVSGGVAGGVGFDDDGVEIADYTDRLGHGTAVTAAIREKAPEAEIYVVKIFDRALTAATSTLVRALDWCVANRMHFVNLSLGTANPAYEEMLRVTVARIEQEGSVLVAAQEDDGIRWFPGCLPGVRPVAVDWNCPRDRYRTSHLSDGRTLYHASGYARPIPGVPPERNLKGISFAVANVTGLLARESTER